MSSRRTNGDRDDNTESARALPSPGAEKHNARRWNVTESPDASSAVHLLAIRRGYAISNVALAADAWSAIG